jgi:hypothetical protein
MRVTTGVPILARVVLVLVVLVQVGMPLGMGMQVEVGMGMNIRGIIVCCWRQLLLQDNMFGYKSSQQSFATEERDFTSTGGADVGECGEHFGFRLGFSSCVLMLCPF